jgi:hypothetical protein
VLYTGCKLKVSPAIEQWPDPNPALCPRRWAQMVAMTESGFPMAPRLAPNDHFKIATGL